MGFLDKIFKKKEDPSKAAEAVSKGVDNVVKGVGNAAAAAGNAVDAAAKSVGTAVKDAADKVSAAVGGEEKKVTHLLPMADLGELLPGAPAGGKINLAIYWAAACGGCDVSILDVNERILTIGDMANIVMWPVAADGKEKDIAAMEDGSITVSLISGAVRNTENEHMVKLLRKKSKLVVAYGTCACFGGSPALANLVANGKDEILDYVYTKTPTSAAFQETYHKGAPVLPQQSYQAPEGELTLPALFDTVKTLDQVIDVDYYVPGCPPQAETISQMLKAVADFVYKGVALPPKGTTIGITTKTMCDECHRKKSNARITEFLEPYQVNIKEDVCLMDQGILCLGPSTIGGCGARCTKVGQPCRGCYGPTAEVQEQGASMFTAVASLLPILDDDPICDEEKIVKIVSEIKDPLGYFYAFTLGKALIKKAVKETGGQ